MSATDFRSDDWDALLAPPGPPDPALRELLRQQTSRVVRRRRWIRYAVRAAALAACYLAGLGSSALLPPPATVVTDSPRHPITAPVPPPAPPAPLEQQAELYRQASNRYAAQGDWQAALDASRDALDAGLTEATETDNFVLMAVKADRQKEKRHAASDR